MPRYHIERLEKDDLTIVKRLVQVYEYKPYRYFPGLRNKELSDFVTEELYAYLQCPESHFAYLAKEGKTAVGLAVLRLLPWDKRIFGKEMATMDYLIAIGNYQERIGVLNGLLSRLFNLCVELKIEHLSVRIDTGDLPSMHALEGTGFKSMDTVVSYCFDFAKSSIEELKYPFRIRSHREDDVESILALSRLSFKDYIDRFHSDPTLDNRNCDELYVEWARNSCLGLVADRVTVAENDKAILGFATSKFHEKVNRFTDHKIGEIVLVCVSPNVRGRGVYTSFIHEGLCWFNKKVDFVQVVTQINNIFVQRAWSNVGFWLIGSRSTFHKWF